MARVVGSSQLQARLRATRSVGGRGFMQKLGLEVVRGAKLTVHRKTGNTGRTIHIQSVSEHSVTVVVGGAGLFLEEGTRPHEITPKAAQALRWAASPGGRRLSGAPRIGAAVVFARRVHHPGTRPYLFMYPAALAAAKKIGVDPVIRAWNAAA